MGLDDRDLVALMGGHTVGRTHPENSDFPYMTWDRTKLVFDNVYYEFLLENWWVYDDFDPENPFYFNRYVELYVLVLCLSVCSFLLLLENVQPRFNLSLLSNLY